MAFPPPPVTFPATRLVRLAAPKDLSRLERRRTQLVDHFQRASPVFIQMTQTRPFGQILASLSASVSSDHGQRLSAPSVPGPRVTTDPSLFSKPVKATVINLDCDAILHQPFSVSSRKYFNFRPYLLGFCEYPVDKLWRISVDEMWKIGQLFLCQGLGDLAAFTRSKPDFAKRKNNLPKIFFKRSFSPKTSQVFVCLMTKVILSPSSQ